MCVHEEPISEDELLFRRIPANTNWYEAGRNPPVHRQAFNPNKDDREGLSLSRSKFGTAEEAAQTGRRGKLYYVAALRVRDLLEKRISVVPKPLEGNPGHSELPDLRFDNVKTNEAKELMMQLARLVVRVDGPFPGAVDVPTTPESH